MSGAVGAVGGVVALAGVLVRSAPPESTQQAVGYPSLFLLVVVGSLVPVVPTGAVVSSAAVVAFHQSSPFALLMVFAISAAAAFLGDVGLYVLGQRGSHSRSGTRWLARLRARVAPERLALARRKLRAHGVLVLVLSRLVPAGRIPVMLACLLAAMPLRRFVRGDVPACLAWAAMYQLIGLLSGSLFPEPWQGVAAAVGLTLLISAAPAVWRRVRPAGDEGA
ncbi:VTT domain-containing protein [Streptomyces sp. NPDC048483]|uniref:DedA family protein n=1 Tax=Streptomyces sp. NPDC048483 TaxID=3154927 RepID=UPI0034346AF7